MIGPGHYFPVFPGRVFEYGPDPDTTWHELHLGGVGPGVERWVRYGWIDLSGKVAKVPAGRLDWFSQKWNALQSLDASTVPGDRDRLVLVSEKILLELSLSSVSRSIGKEQDRIAAAIRYIRSHASSQIDFEAVARSHHISYSLLRQQMKQRTGLSPAKYVAELRCDHACRLLAKTDDQVDTIAFAVGYQDSPTFSKAFTRTVGLSPSKYRLASRQLRDAEGAGESSAYNHKP
jgi:AraC-like DNA-binding protein